MAAVSFQPASAQDLAAQFPARQGPPAVPQATGSEGEGAPPQSDTVTLAGRPAESQPSHGDRHGAQFGETANFFFAERQSFRSANGSSAGQTGDPHVPQLPVKLGDVPAGGAGQDAAAAVDSAPSGTNLQGGVPVAASAIAGATGAAANAAGTGGVTSQTPQQELTQLDQTLQAIGIDPQSISLFNRMAMLLYASDPAALRVLVQTLQEAVQQSGGAAQLSPGAAQNPSANQSSGPLPSATSNSGPTPQAEAATAQVTAISFQETLTASDSGSGSGASSQNAAPNSGAETLSIQLEGLQVTFAAVGVQQYSQNSQGSSGTTLNVNA